MQISVIYNHNRRKKMMEFSLGEVERMVHRVENYGGGTQYLCRPNDDEDKYTLVVHQKDLRKSLIIEPPQEFVDFMEMKHLVG